MIFGLDDCVDGLVWKSNCHMGAHLMQTIIWPVTCMLLPLLVKLRVRNEQPWTM